MTSERFEEKTKEATRLHEGYKAIFVNVPLDTFVRVFDLAQDKVQWKKVTTGPYKVARTKKEDKMS